MKITPILLFFTASLIHLAPLNAIAPITPPSVTWGTPTGIIGDSDVSTVGTLVSAYKFGGSSVTVNGVAFTGVTFNDGSTTVSFGGNSLSESPGVLYNFRIDTLGNPFNSLSANYKTLLGSGVYADNGSTMTLTLNGLTSGTQYQIQFWSNNSTGSNSITTITSGNSVALSANSSNTAGGIGQFTLGTFTANSSSQSFTMNGAPLPYSNAYQLRAIPEPSTYALLLGGAALLGITLQRRRAAR